MHNYPKGRVNDHILFLKGQLPGNSNIWDTVDHNMTWEITEIMLLMCNSDLNVYNAE